MKVAVVHEWLVTLGGSERVLAEILDLYPEADLFTLVDVLPEEHRGFLAGRKIHTSFIQSLPFVRRHHRSYLSLMPLAVEQFDLSGYDLVITSSHAVAKGVLTGPDQLHISYVHTPIRYAWDMQHQYLRQAGLDRGIRGLLAKSMLHRIRAWDQRTANGVDHFVANSHFIARRIWKVYRREATVIYPPIDVESLPFRETKEEFFLAVSRMVPYKRLDVIVEAFRSMPDRKLVVIGEGPELPKIRKLAGANVQLLGYQPSEVLVEYLSRARAFLFAAEEDFGILPVEAQACGTPVIAYGRGGVTESVRGLDHSSPTGVFFPEQSAASIREAIDSFERNEKRITPAECRDNSLRFSTARFRDEFGAFVRDHRRANPSDRPNTPAD